MVCRIYDRLVYKRIEVCKFNLIVTKYVVKASYRRDIRRLSKLVPCATSAIDLISGILCIAQARIYKIPIGCVSSCLIAALGGVKVARNKNCTVVFCLKLVYEGYHFCGLLGTDNNILLLLRSIAAGICIVGADDHESLSAILMLKISVRQDSQIGVILYNKFPRVALYESERVSIIKNRTEISFSVLSCNCLVYASCVSALRKPADGFTLNGDVAKEEKNSNTDGEILIGNTCRTQTKSEMDKIGYDGF